MVHAIHPNDDLPSESTHLSGASSKAHFTADEATKMLPLIRHILDEARQLSLSIEQQRQQLAGIDDAVETIDREACREEVKDMRATVEDDESRLTACMDELTAIGARPHVPFDGCVDFPAIVNRRPVMLCWNRSEPTVSYWHETDDTSSDRLRVPRNSLTN
ncbi:hypothetical protein CA13_50030 [Planctomycetes bacterium CA13]|uniref:DUF2203 domain-containing protein n=1 Tax=Novipirellula herctigrandis TaxID=2527986 RepID=A0A5C5Z8I0_9BACT|nr:hypothetical protein CA13_50030 [Planctomycetes bacterium CA13]